MTALLTVTGLTKRFGDLLVLDAIDLSIPKGEVVVLMGPSGSGKTTLLRSINGLESPECGTVTVANATVDFAAERRAREKAMRAVRLRTAMVFQHFNLFPHRTVLENVIEGPCQVRGVAKAEATERAMRLLARMGLADRAGDYPARLSGGQKQRVAIARGLAMEPDLMLFDEPTSALDPTLRSEVLNVMRELATEGMTMLVVTHEVGFAREVADRVVLFGHGRLLADAPPAECFGPDASTAMRLFLGSVT